MGQKAKVKERIGGTGSENEIAACYSLQRKFPYTEIFLVFLNIFL